MAGEAAGGAGGEGARSVVVRGRGHPCLRASHEATLELTGERAVTARATCVVAVESDLDADALGLLRGRVRLAVTAGGLTVAGEATINPDHQVRHRLVVRRSGHREPDTLAVGSTLVAADVRRTTRRGQPDPSGSPGAGSAPAAGEPPAGGLLAAVADPGAPVTLTVTELEPPPPLVVVSDSEPAGRPGLLWRHADGERVRAVPTARAGAVPPGTRVAVPGFPACEALLAAGLPRTPALVLGELDRQALRRPGTARSLRAAPWPVVLHASAGVVAEVLAAVDPLRLVAVPDGRLDVGTAMTWTSAEAAAAEDGWVVLGAGEPPDASGDAGADLLEVGWLVRALVAEGVSPRTLGEALGPLGVPRRRVYELLDRQRRDRPPDSGAPR